MIYAIDYGTSNSLLAAATKEKTFDPVPLDHSNDDSTIFRSVMFFGNEGGAWFGKEAIRTYDESRAEGRLFRSIKKYLPVKSFTGTQVAGDVYGVESLVGRFLKEMKARADAHFDQSVDSVVLGRPARFSIDDEEDKLAQIRLEKAARLAGFKHIDFYPEPLAAAYEFRKKIQKEKLVLVADLGGGTSDYTVLKLSQQDFKPSDVLAVGGISVAGDAIDSSIMMGKISPFLGSEVQYRLPMSSNVLQMPVDIKYKLGSPPDIALMTKIEVMTFLKSVQKATFNQEDKKKLDRLFALIEENLGFKIYESIEALKRALGQAPEAVFSFPYPDIDIETKLSQPEYQEVSKEKIKAIMGALDETVKQAGVTHSQIEIVCSTGGTAKVPEIQRLLQRRFGRATIEQFKNFHSVIQGLAERAKESLDNSEY